MGVAIRECMAALDAALSTFRLPRLAVAGLVAAGALAATPVARWAREEIHDPDTRGADAMYSAAGAAGVYVLSTALPNFLAGPATAVSFGMLVAAFINAKRTLT